MVTAPAGCPAAFTFDYAPNQIMRMLQVGLVDKALDSSAVQLCVQCLTCTERCPRNIRISRIIEEPQTSRRRPARPEHVTTFNQAFMKYAFSAIEKLPFYSMARFYTGTMNPKMAIWLADMGLMKPMVSRGKMKFVPHKHAGTDEVARIYKKAMERARAREKSAAAAGPRRRPRPKRERA